MFRITMLLPSSTLIRLATNTWDLSDHIKITDDKTTTDLSHPGPSPIYGPSANCLFCRSFFSPGHRKASSLYKGLSKPVHTFCAQPWEAGTQQAFRYLPLENLPAALPKCRTATKESSCAPRKYILPDFSCTSGSSSFCPCWEKAAVQTAWLAMVSSSLSYCFLSLSERA